MLLLSIAMLACAGGTADPARPLDGAATAGEAGAREATGANATGEKVDSKPRGGAGSVEPTVDDSVPTRPLPALCARPGEDRVKELFCGHHPPAIDSLRALQQALGFDYDPLFGPSVQGLSTALSARIISPLNPRVITLSGDGGALAFQRGVQQLEIAVPTTADQQLAFYLVSFQQACNARDEGCLPADLYTPRVESDWLSVSVEDDEDLKNTTTDCRQCHQRDRQRPILLMRELEAPWTHFFAVPPSAAGNLPPEYGQQMARDFQDSHGDEVYAGLPPESLLTTAGFFLENAVLREQPLVFDASRINAERWPVGPDGAEAAEPLRSPTWDRAYEAFKRGEQLPLPHYSRRPTDPAKEAKLAQAYKAYRAGALTASELPDLADIFPDDPAVRAEIGLQTEPGAAPADALIQACGSCHNDVLDQSISRARFNIDLSRMSSRARSVAVERLLLPADDVGAMPPAETRQLDDLAKAALIEYLQQDEHPEEDLDRLRYAAEQGMMGGALEDPLAPPPPTRQ